MEKSSKYVADIYRIFGLSSQESSEAVAMTLQEISEMFTHTTVPEKDKHVFPIVFWINPW
jgi:hypothetical protein